MSFPGSILLNGQQYNPTKDKRHPLGTRGYTRDGRVFRYASAGAAIVPGCLVSAAAEDAELRGAVCLAAATDWAVPTSNSTVFYLATENSLATADWLTDGYLMVTAGASTHEVGQMIQLDKQAIQTAANGVVVAGVGSARVFAYPEDKLTHALTTANTISLIHNPYYAVTETAAGTPTSIPVGVSVCAVTSAYYFWLQTWGMACLRSADTWVAGRVLINSSITSDRTGEAYALASIQADKGAAVVGMAQYIGTDLYWGAAFITLAP